MEIYLVNFRSAIRNLHELIICPDTGIEFKDMHFAIVAKDSKMLEHIGISTKNESLEIVPALCTSKNVVVT